MPKSEQPAATAEHGTGGSGSFMAETHIGSPPEERDTKPGLQVIVLVCIYSPLLCIPFGAFLLPLFYSFICVSSSSSTLSLLLFDLALDMAA